MLATLRGNAERLGLEVETAACDAAALPFADAEFDLVLGHAVLHHLPELDRAFAEFPRVLRPGGVLLFAGEPSRYGDRIAARAQARRRGRRAAVAADGPCARGRRRRPTAARPTTTRWSRWSTSTRSRPAELERHAAPAGFEGVRVRGEELLANWFGWFNRTRRGERGARATSRSAGSATPTAATSLLQKVDARVLEPHLPAAGFYNLMLAARKPG